MIKAGIFDVGGVLHDASTKYIYPDIITTLGITKEAFDKVWKRLINLFGKGEISEEEFWKVFIKQTQSTKPLPKESLFLREFIKHYNRHEDVLSLVQKLKRNGYRVAILSNSIPPHARYQYEIGIYQNFDVVVLSHEVGIQKPDPEIYALTLEKLGVTAAEAFFVDDLKANVDPAIKLGMHGLIFTKYKVLQDDLQGLGLRT